MSWCRLSRPIKSAHLSTHISARPWFTGIMLIGMNALSPTLYNLTRSNSVAFYGDYIFSRAAAEEYIVMWAIENFSSEAPPPKPDEAPPVNGWKDTRSAFGGTFRRLLQFSAPDTSPFYMHFGLWNPENEHPLLVMGNTRGKTYIWDLRMIETFGTGPSSDDEDDSSSESPPLPPGAHQDVIDERLDILIQPHKILETSKIRTPVRSFAFSPDSKYIVQVGEACVISLLNRR